MIFLVVLLRRTQAHVSPSLVVVALVIGASVFRLAWLAYDPFYFGRAGASAAASYVVGGLVFPLLVTAYALVSLSWLQTYMKMRVVSDRKSRWYTVFTSERFMRAFSFVFALFRQQLACGCRAAHHTTLHMRAAGSAHS